jgi:hypothetical protein
MSKANLPKRLPLGPQLQAMRDFSAAAFRQNPADRIAWLTLHCIETTEKQWAQGDFGGALDTLFRLAQRRGTEIHDQRHHKMIRAYYRQQDAQPRARRKERQGEVPPRPYRQSRPRDEEGHGLVVEQDCERLGGSAGEIAEKGNRETLRRQAAGRPHDPGHSRKRGERIRPLSWRFYTVLPTPPRP